MHWNFGLSRFSSEYRNFPGIIFTVISKIIQIKNDIYTVAEFT